MEPKEFIDEIIPAYKRARVTKKPHKNVERGRSHSISSELEDMMAFYLAEHDSRGRTFFVDQPVKLDGVVRYPDIMIQSSTGEIENLVDLKTDLGWSREGLNDLAKKWNERVFRIRKQSPVTFKRGSDKEKLTGHFSPNLKYHIAILSMKNGSARTQDHFDDIKSGKFPNIEIYQLSKGDHPNSYHNRNNGEETKAVETEIKRLTKNLVS